MSEGKLIDQIRQELGPINLENQALYYDYYCQVRSWNEGEAIGWIKIFAEDDDDDYTAFAWDIVMLVEQHITTEGLSELANVRSYWGRIAFYGATERFSLNRPV